MVVVVVVVAVVMVVSPRGILPNYQVPRLEGVESHGLICALKSHRREMSPARTSISHRDRIWMTGSHINGIFPNWKYTKTLLQLELGMYRTVTYTPGRFLLSHP